MKDESFKHGVLSFCVTGKNTNFASQNRTKHKRMMGSMNFGDTLRGLLEEREITQKQLAADLNAAPSTIGGYVQNSSEPDFAMLKLLAQYFGVTTDYLLDCRSGHTVSQQEDELLRIFRALSAEQQEICVAQCRVFLRVRHREQGEPPR